MAKNPLAPKSIAGKASLTASDAVLQAVDSRLAALEERLNFVAEKVVEVATISHKLIRRQVVTLDDGFAAIRSLYGWYVIPQEEQSFLLHLADGISGHEAGTLAVLRKIVAPGDVVVDAGAHIGLLALPLAQMVGPEGRVIALEPNPRAAESLRRTLSSNLVLDRSDVVEAAASNSDDTAEFFFGANSMMGSLVLPGDGHGSTLVRTVMLDSLIPGGARIDVVKMDVEGAENLVMSGMRRVLAENPQILVIAEFGPYHLRRVGVETRDWFALFQNAGLNEYFVVDEVSGECSRASISQLEQMFSVNLLFCRSDNPKLRAVDPQV